MQQNIHETRGSSSLKDATSTRNDYADGFGLWRFAISLGGVLLLMLIVLQVITPDKKDVQAQTERQVTLAESTNSRAKEDALAAKSASVSDLSKVQYFHYCGQGFRARIVNSAIEDIRFFYKNKNGENHGNFSRLKEAVQAQGVQLDFATNAGIFRKDGSPEGLFINAGATIVPLNKKNGKGNFYLKPNGVFSITKNGKCNITETKKYSDSNIVAHYATQSGPLLLEDGLPHPAFNEGSPNRLLRSGVGVLPGGQAIFVISEGPVNFYDFALVFRDYFSCRNALYLDGVISGMYLPGDAEPRSGDNFSGLIGIVRDEGI